MSIVQKDGKTTVEFTGEQFKSQIKDRVQELIEHQTEAKKTILDKIEQFTRSENRFKLNLYQSKLEETENKIKDLEKMLQ